jgi:hypothetical protein
VPKRFTGELLGAKGIQIFSIVIKNSCEKCVIFCTFMVQKNLVLGHFLSFLAHNQHIKLCFEKFELILCVFLYTLFVMKM